MNAISELTSKGLECVAKLNSLCSTLTDSIIESELNLSSSPSKVKSWYEFSKFKASVQDYKFHIEQFEKNKEWNFEHEFTRTRISYISVFREKAEGALVNAKRIIQETTDSRFKNLFIQSLKDLVDSINTYLFIVRTYLQEMMTDFDYQNLVKENNLEDLKFTINSSRVIEGQILDN